MNEIAENRIDSKSTPTISILAAFAIAMALLEAAVVVYMRRLYYPENPLEIFPLSFLNSYDPILELSREAATIVMIVTVALLADRSTWTKAFAGFVFVFGVWDLFYYVWLKVLMGWPTSWLEWDVLFLIPWLWLGPWICPALIATLFIVWGFLALRTTKPIAFTPTSTLIFVSGSSLGLASFFQPAIAVTMNEGAEALTTYMPGNYWWWLFAISYLLMTIGFVMTFRVNSNN